MTCNGLFRWSIKISHAFRSSLFLAVPEPATNWNKPQSACLHISSCCVNGMLSPSHQRRSKVPIWRLKCMNVAAREVILGSLLLIGLFWEVLYFCENSYTVRNLQCNTMNCPGKTFQLPQRIYWSKFFVSSSLRLQSRCASELGFEYDWMYFAEYIYGVKGFLCVCSHQVHRVVPQHEKHLDLLRRLTWHPTLDVSGHCYSHVGKLSHFPHTHSYISSLCAYLQ